MCHMLWNYVPQHWQWTENQLYSLYPQILPKYRGENMEKTETILEKSWGYPLFGQPLALLVQTGV